MKLRLPHKFQAALMAALASVSFTTLSTGTLTVAAGAALLAGQQAQANVQEQIITDSVTVGGVTYTAEDGVRVVKGDGSDNTPINLGEGVTAEYTFLTSTNTSGGTNQGRYAVNADAATRMANYGTIIVANGTADGVTYNGGQIIVSSGVTVSNNLILGTSNYSEANWNGAIRMGGATFTGNALIVQDAKFTVSNSNTFAGTVSGADKKLELGQGGTLTFAGDLTLKTLNAASASVVFSGSHVVISGSGQDEGIHQAGGTVTVGGGAGTTLMELGRLEMGDAQSGSSSLNVLNGSTLKITGSNNNENYKQASFILGEWSTATTATIGGTVLSKDADVRAGDKGGTINIASSGTLAAMGIRTSMSATDNRFTVNVNGGRLILGSDGILAQSLNLNSGATLGLYAASANITGPTSLNGLVTFDTQMYAFAADGNSVGRATSGTTAINVTGATTIAGGAHLSQVGGGSVSFTGSSVNIAGPLATDGALGIGTSTTALSVGGTIANSGSLSLAGNLTFVTPAGFEIHGSLAEGDFDGTGEYAGSGHRIGGSTQYYVVKGAEGSTLDISGIGSYSDATRVDVGSAKDLVVTFDTGVSDTTYYVNKDLTYNSDVMGADTRIAVAPGATLTVDSDPAAVLSRTYGAGNVTISASGTITGGGASAPYTTHATGTLTVAANTTLTLGTNKDSQYLDFSSFSAVELGSGAVINLKQHGMTLNNVSVASGTAHLGKNDDKNDTLNEHIDAVSLLGTTLVNGELQMGTNWKWQMSIDKLAGSGTVVARGANENHHLIINSAEDFHGTLKYSGSNSEIVVSGSASFTLDNGDNNSNTLTLRGGEGVTVQIAAAGETKLTNTTTMSGGGVLSLLTNPGGRSVTLKTITASTLKLTADAGHNSRFVYNGSSNLSGVQNLYFDGGQLWLNNGGTALNFAGSVTFGTENKYDETNGLDSAFRVNSSAKFSGAVDVQKDAKITWQAEGKYMEFADKVTGSGNLTLAVYNNTQYNNSKFIISGDASGYQGSLTTSHTCITVEIKENAKLTLAGGSSLTGNVTLDGALKMSGSENTTSTISGTVSGSGSLTVDGAGTLTLSHANNTYSGGTTVNGGTVNVNAQNALGSGNVTVNGGTVNLGGTSHTLSTLTVNGGTVTTTNNSGSGCITGDIYINAGGTFQVNGGHDAFGYSGGQTDSIVMQGAAGSLATLQLNQNNTTNSVTMQTNLVMKGYSAITSKEGTKGFNTFGGSITVTGDHNTIDIVDIRNNATIEVTNAGDELAIAKMTKNGAGDKVLTKTGVGTLRFTGSAAANSLNVNAGTVSFADSADIANNLSLGAGTTLATAGTVAVGGTASLAAGSSWTNTGSNATVGGNFTSAGALANSGTMTFNGDFSMATGATVTNTGAITFNGAHTLTLAQDGFVNNTGGSVTLNSGTVFNLANLTAENNTYTLFTGNANVDLSGYGFSVANITGFSGEGQASDYGWTFNTNGTITYSETKAFEWGGTAGGWMAENAWTKNGTPATYESSVDSDALFNASEDPDFIKEVTVGSPVVAHNVTVKDAYSFTLESGGSITATALALEGDSASLSINGTGTVAANGISGGKTVTLDSGILLQGGTADAFILDGSGTYALGAGTSALGSVSLEDSWNGTLKFSNVATYTNINLNDTAFKNTSAVEFDGVTGNWCDGQNEFTRRLVLSGQGLTLSNGYSSANYYFDGGISGAGDMNYTWTASVTQNLHFRKGISGWTGSLNLLNGFTVNANFYGEATDVYAGISRTGGTLNVNVGDGTNAYTATFHNTVGASALTVKAQANATFNEAVTLTGDINLNGNSTATFEKAVSAAALTVGDTKSTGATATFDGDLTLSGGFSLNGTEAANATVALNGDTTVNGSFDLSNGQTAHGTVTLATGKTLDLKGSIWMSQNASLVLQQNATAKLGTALTVKGLEDGATITRPGSADQYGLNNSSYTLTKVEATVNNDQNDVQLRFADSKFVTSHNVTLKNLQSVFSGMDIQGGTTTVGASNAAGTVQLGAVTLSGGGNLTLASGVTGAASGVDVAGTGTISGGTLKMAENAVITMSASGALTLSGVTVDLTAKELQGGETGYEDTKGDFSETGNGFAVMRGMVQLVDFTAGGSVTEGENVQYVRGVNHGSLIQDGDDKGYATFDDTNYTAYFMNVADTTEILSDIQTKAGFRFSDVYLNAGTLDTTGAEMLNTLHVNSGEGTVYVTGDTASIITLDGSGRLSAGAGTNLNGSYLNIAEGDTLTLEGGATITYDNISNQGTLDIGANTTVAVTNTGMGASGTTFTTTGEGVLQTGGFTLSGGTVSLGSDAKLTGNVQLNSGRLDIGGDTDVDGTLLLGTGDGYTSDIHVLENASLTVNSITASWGFHSLTVDGALNVDDELKLSTGSQTYTIEGSGTVNTNKLTLANVGKYVIDGSDGLTLVVGSGGISDGGSNHTLTLANGLTVKASAGWAMGQNAMLDGTVTVDTQGYDVTISSVLSNASGATGNIAKNGAGTLVLSGNNTYSGDTTVNGGTLELSGANTYTGATTVNAGTLKTNHLGNGGTTVNAGTLELTGAITAGGNLTLTDGATLVLAGANMLTMDGGLSLSGDVTFDLNNIIPPSQGDYVLATGSSASIADGAVITVNWDSKPEYFSMSDVHVVDGTKWVITLTSLGQDLIWNGGDGIWSSTAQMWHTDSLQDQVFRTGDSAIFEESDTPAFAMLAEAVEADKVTVQSGATVAIMAGEGEVSLTAAEMEVAGNLSTGANVTATEIVGNGEAATWTIGSGTTVTTGVLEVEDGAALSFSGSGTLTAGTITGDGTIAFGEGFQQEVTAITVATGKELALSGAVNKTIAMSNLSLEGTLVLQDGYHLTISDTLPTGTASLNICNNAALTVSLGNADTILNMDAGSDGDLYLNSGYISYRSVLGDQTVHMANGTQLWFGAKPGTDADVAVFTNDIVLDGDATVRVYGSSNHTSASISGDVNGAGHTLTKADGNQVLAFTGAVTLGGLTTANDGGGTIQFAGGEGSVGSIVTNGPTKIQFSAASDPDAKNEYSFTTFNMAPSSGVRWLVVDKDVKVSGTGNGLGSDNIKATINGGWDLNGGGLDVNGSLVLAGAVSFDGPGATTIKGSGDITATALNISNGTTTTIQGGVTINIVPSDDTSISANHTGIFKRAGADSTLNLADATLTATTKDWEMKGSINTVNLTNASTGTAFNAADGRTITLSKAMGGAGKLVKAGDGTVLLTGNNSYSGGTSINAGKVVTNHTNALGSGNVDIAATAALEMQSDLTIAGVLSGTGSITYNKATDGTLTLSKNQTNQTLGMNISATDTGKLNLALNGNSDYTFSGNVSVNNITQSASVTLFVSGAGSVTTTGTVTTGRLVVGETSTETGAVFTLSGEDAMLVTSGDATDHTYGNKVQGYGTFKLEGGAKETLTGDLINSPGPGFHGTFAADGAGSVLTLNTTLASDVTFKATNGGEIVLAKAYTMGDNTAVDGGTVSVSNGLTVNGTVDLSKGTLTQTGGTIAVNTDKSLTLGNASITSAIANSGAVTFTQDITATGLAEASEQYSVGVDDERSTNGNYFYQGKRTEGTLTVVTGGGTVTTGGIKVTQGDYVYTLKADGTATGVTADGVDYSTFYQGEAGSTVSVSQIAATAAKHNAELLGVYSLGSYPAPTVLNVDQDVKNVMLGFATMNIDEDVNFTGDLLIFGGMNTVSGQVGTEQLGFFAAQDSVTTFTDAAIQNGGVTFTSDQGAGGVVVQANKVADDDENYYYYAINDGHYAVIASELSKEGESASNVANSLQVQRVHNSKASSTGKLTLSAGAFNMSLNEVIATSGDVEFLNMAVANGTTEGKQTSVSLNKLEIGAGKTVSFYEATAPTSVEDMVRECAVTVTGTLTAGAGATLNAGLNMAAGSHLDVSGAQSSMGLIMGSPVTLNSGMFLDIEGYAQDEVSGYLYDYLSSGEHDLYYLYIGKAGDPIELTINGVQQQADLDKRSWNDYDMDANTIYANLQAQTFYVRYDGSNVGMVAIGLIPEPTTSTLSLLALCALAARRRRK